MLYFQPLLYDDETRKSAHKWFQPICSSAEGAGPAFPHLSHPPKKANSTLPACVCVPEEVGGAAAVQRPVCLGGNGHTSLGCQWAGGVVRELCRVDLGHWKTGSCHWQTTAPPSGVWQVSLCALKCEHLVVLVKASKKQKKQKKQRLKNQSNIRGDSATSSSSATSLCLQDSTANLLSMCDEIFCTLRELKKTKHPTTFLWWFQTVLLFVPIVIQQCPKYLLVHLSSAWISEIHFLLLFLRQISPSKWTWFYTRHGQPTVWGQMLPMKLLNLPGRTTRNYN